MMETLFDSLLTDETTQPNRAVIQPLYGGGKQAIEAMTINELAQVSTDLMAVVRTRAFSRGLPIIYEIGGDVVREYADGRTERLV